MTPGHPIANKGDGRCCDYCKRFDDATHGHNCPGCGAWIAPRQFIDVTTFASKRREYLSVPA